MLSDLHSANDVFCVRIVISVRIYYVISHSAFTADTQICPWTNLSLYRLYNRIITLLRRDDAKCIVIMHVVSVCPLPLSHTTAQTRM